MAHCRELGFTSRLAPTPLEGLGEWIGYWVSPRGSAPQFHDLPDRAFDAEVFFPESKKRLRAFYWHAHQQPACGVITFEEAPDEDPVWKIARELADYLGAELVGEDDTAYEQ